MSLTPQPSNLHPSSVRNEYDESITNIINLFNCVPEKRECDRTEIERWLHDAASARDMMWISSRKMRSCHIPLYDLPAVEAALLPTIMEEMQRFLIPSRLGSPQFSYTWDGLSHQAASCKDLMNVVSRETQVDRDVNVSMVGRTDTELSKDDGLLSSPEIYLSSLYPSQQPVSTLYGNRSLEFSRDMKSKRRPLSSNNSSPKSCENTGPLKSKDSNVSYNGNVKHHKRTLSAAMLNYVLAKPLQIDSKETQPDRLSVEGVLSTTVLGAPVPSIHDTEYPGMQYILIDELEKGNHMEQVSDAGSSRGLANFSFNAIDTTMSAKEVQGDTCVVIDPTVSPKQKYLHAEDARTETLDEATSSLNSQESHSGVAPTILIRNAKFSASLHERENGVLRSAASQFEEALSRIEFRSSNPLYSALPQHRLPIASELSSKLRQDAESSQRRTMTTIMSKECESATSLSSKKINCPNDVAVSESEAATRLSTSVSHPVSRPIMGPPQSSVPACEHAHIQREHDIKKIVDENEESPPVADTGEAYPTPLSQTVCNPLLKDNIFTTAVLELSSEDASFTPNSLAADLERTRPTITQQGETPVLINESETRSEEKLDTDASHTPLTSCDISPVTVSGATAKHLAVQSLVSEECDASVILDGGGGLVSPYVGETSSPILIPSLQTNVSYEPPLRLPKWTLASISSLADPQQSQDEVPAVQEERKNITDDRDASRLQNDIGFGTPQSTLSVESDCAQSVAEVVEITHASSSLEITHGVDGTTAVPLAERETHKRKVVEMDSETEENDHYQKISDRTDNEMSDTEMARRKRKKDILTVPLHGNRKFRQRDGNRVKESGITLEDLAYSYGIMEKVDKGLFLERRILENRGMKHRSNGSFRAHARNAVSHSGQVFHAQAAAPMAQASPDNLFVLALPMSREFNWNFMKSAKEDCREGVHGI
ncbi:hypothetical protein BU17DRAFT_67123 [Hysterangium stoloniferum]|nr:hypothetical protein BU17DRAFT_67123 [Hysterangium stoloniferum]